MLLMLLLTDTVPTSCKLLKIDHTLIQNRQLSNHYGEVMEKVVVHQPSVHILYKYLFEKLLKLFRLSARPKLLLLTKW